MLEIESSFSYRIQIIIITLFNVFGAFDFILFISSLQICNSARVRSSIDLSALSVVIMAIMAIMAVSRGIHELI